MTESAQAYVIGLAVDAASVEDAEWFTLWLDGDRGPTVVATKQGRIQWTRTASAAMDLDCNGALPAGSSELAAVCDVTGCMHAVLTGEPGLESEVLGNLNLLDDLLISIGQRDDLPGRLTLDRLVGELTRGERLPPAVETVGGPQAVAEAIVSSAGRVFLFSTFLPG